MHDLEKKYETSGVDRIEQYAAHIVSALFHPMFLPIVACFYIVVTHPSHFEAYDSRIFSISLIIIFVLTCLFPLIALLVMKGLGIIKSIQLHERKDRIVPLIVAGSFLVWTFMTFKPINEAASEATMLRENIFMHENLIACMLLGVTLCLFTAFILNVFIKVSIHTASCGAAICLVLSTVQSAEVNVSSFLVLIVLLSGMVGTARLVLKAHSTREIYLGYFAGFVSMFIAFRFFHYYYS